MIEVLARLHVTSPCIYLCSHAVAIGLSQSGGNALLAVLLTTAFLVLFGGNFVILGMLYREKTKNLHKVCTLFVCNM